MGVEPTRTGFADRCLSRSTITPLLTFDVTIYHRFRKMQAVFLKNPKDYFRPVTQTISDAGSQWASISEKPAPERNAHSSAGV